jgi:hypothetical protein
MSNPTHLPPAADEDFMRQLFVAARRREVPEASRQRVALALGLGPLPPIAGSQEAGGGLGASELPAPSLAAGVAPSKLVLFSKAALVGLAGGMLALGVSLRSGETPNGSQRESASASASEALAAIPRGESLPPSSMGAEHGAATARMAVPSLAASDVPDNEAADNQTADNQTAPPRAEPRLARARRAERSRAQAPLRDPESRLLAEVRLLDEAREALAAGQATLALATLSRYADQFSGGTLSLDAAVLEVRALARAGQRTAAHRLALRTLSRSDSARYRSELETFAHPLASGSKRATAPH